MSAFETLPGLKLEDGEPVFSEPWEASAFALVVELYNQGVFSWDEWAETLGQTIKANDPDTAYYQNWLDALQAILENKSVLASPEVKKREEEWAAAVYATPHGQPIKLQNGIIQAK